MQRDVPINPPSTSLNPLKDAVGVTSVDYSAQFDGLVKKSRQSTKFYRKRSSRRSINAISTWNGKTALSRSN